MNKVSKYLIAGGGVVAGAAAAGAATYASTKFLVDVAMDRAQPQVKNPEKARNRLRGYGFAPQFFRQMSAAAKKLESTPHTTVRLKSYDGHTLVGHWFPCPREKRVIVAMHGWRSGWSSDFGTVADFWHKNGCSVLYAEQRGQGNSGGEFMSFGIRERFDCLHWIAWINAQRRTAPPVYLAGVSMGATTVLLTADQPLPENVRGIMADCGFTSAHDIWKHVAEKNLHLSFALRGAIADALCRDKIHIGTRECSTLNALKKATVPILFVHGTEDHFVPVEMTYKNYRACASEKQLLIVPGADHGMSHFTETDRYEQAMTDFWKCYDRGQRKAENEFPF